MKKILTLLLFSFALVPALFAQDATSAAAFAALGAGLAIGIAALGGGIGQGLASASALEGISRNPGASDKIFVPMIIGLALFIESLVIYALLIAKFKIALLREKNVLFFHQDKRA